MIRAGLNHSDRPVSALKTLYSALGLIEPGVELEMVLAEDVDDAELLSGGDSAYPEALWYDGVKTDCLPPREVLERLKKELPA